MVDIFIECVDEWLPCRDGGQYDTLDGIAAVRSQGREEDVNIALGRELELVHAVKDRQCIQLIVNGPACPVQADDGQVLRLGRLINMAGIAVVGVDRCAAGIPPGELIRSGNGLPGSDGLVQYH